MAFYIDEEEVGTFLWNPEGTPQQNYTYNALVYKNTFISPGQHTFMLVNGVANNQESLVLLDYLIYS